MCETRNTKPTLICLSGPISFCCQNNCRNYNGRMEQPETCFLYLLHLGIWHFSSKLRWWGRNHFCTVTVRQDLSLESYEPSYHLTSFIYIPGPALYDCVKFLIRQKKMQRYHLKQSIA